MCLLRKITYDEFSEFVQEKKVHIMTIYFFFGLIFLGLVLFLEEDHFVSEDFLHVLKLVEAERTQKYSNCDIICLGTYLKSYNYNRNHKNVSVSVQLLGTFYRYILYSGYKYTEKFQKKSAKKLAIFG